MKQRGGRMKVFNVWLEIEEYDDDKDNGVDLDCQKIGEYKTYKKAYVEYKKLLRDVN